MVEPLGTKSFPTGDRRLAPVTRISSTAPATSTGSPEADAISQSSLASEAQQLAASPPVDQERVARIRRAIADGTFPILPAQVADRLIALKLEWNPNEARS